MKAYLYSPDFCILLDRRTDMASISVVDPDPKLFVGSGSGTQGYGSVSGFETGLEPFQKSLRELAI
jgi:hypothetical protein